MFEQGSKMRERVALASVPHNLQVRRPEDQPPLGRQASSANLHSTRDLITLPSYTDSSTNLGSEEESKARLLCPPPYLLLVPHFGWRTSRSLRTGRTATRRRFRQNPPHYMSTVYSMYALYQHGASLFRSPSAENRASSTTSQPRNRGHASPPNASSLDIYLPWLSCSS